MTKLLLTSTSLSGMLLGFAFLLGGIGGRRAQDRDTSVVICWSALGFLLFNTCAMSPMIGTSVPLGAPTAHLLLYLAVLVAASGFAVALKFVPWLLKPACWQDFWDSEQPTRQRFWILSVVVAVMLPFSGLLNPLWQLKIDRRIGHASRSSTVAGAEGERDGY